MWGFVDCTRYFVVGGEVRPVLFHADMVVRTHEKVALFVPSGQGKTTIIRLLSGAEYPDDGVVLRDEGGFPLGYAGAFRPELSGAENVRSFATLFDVDAAALEAFAYDFAELGEVYFRSFGDYTSSQKAQLVFATSFGLPVRTFLADDKLSAGPPAFRAKATAFLTERLKHAGLIYVGSTTRGMDKMCDRFFVLDKGRIAECADLAEAEARLAEGRGLDGGRGDADSDLPEFDLA